MSRQRIRKLNQSPGKGLEKFLGELELEVMEIVWQRGTATVSDVQEVLNEQNHELAYTTVMTIMSRLVEKGWLLAEKQGRAFAYQAVNSRKEAEAQAVGGILRTLIEDFGEIAVAQFVKQLDEIDPEQLARLAQLLDTQDNMPDETE